MFNFIFEIELDDLEPQPVGMYADNGDGNLLVTFLHDGKVPGLSRSSPFDVYSTKTKQAVISAYEYARNEGKPVFMHVFENLYLQEYKTVFDATSRGLVEVNTRFTYETAVKDVQSTRLTTPVSTL